MIELYFTFHHTNIDLHNKYIIVSAPDTVSAVSKVHEIYGAIVAFPFTKEDWKHEISNSQYKCIGNYIVTDKYFKE